jgi:guanine deaminase
LLREEGSLNNEELLRLAIELASSNVSSGEGGPFGCIIVHQGKVLAEGVNRVTSTNDPTAHAEIVAIREACAKLNTFQLADCELYTSCEPCPMCLGAIYWARVDRVYFAATQKEAAEAGFDDSFIYDEIAKGPLERRIPMERLLAGESRKPFELWLAAEGKITY